MFKLKPLADRVVIKPLSEEKMTKGGIYLPETASKEKPFEGTVVAVGPGRNTDKGERIALNLKVDDKVIYSKYAGSEIKVEGDEYIIISEKDILATVV